MDPPFSVPKKKNASTSRLPRRSEPSTDEAKSTCATPRLGRRKCAEIAIYKNCVVVELTRLQNMSQNGNLPQIKKCRIIHNVLFPIPSMGRLYLHLVDFYGIKVVNISSQLYTHSINVGKYTIIPWMLYGYGKLTQIAGWKILRFFLCGNFMGI